MVLDMSSIADALNQLDTLPNNASTNTVQGLSLASHLKFAKMFTNCASNLTNTLLKRVKLEGNTTFEKISTVLATTLKTYVSYCVSTGNTAWM